jgi:hypothetical protein
MFAAALTCPVPAEIYRLKSAAELPDAGHVPAQRLAPDTEHAFPSNRPILTLLHYPNEKSPKHAALEVAMSFIKRTGVTHVWGWPPEEPSPFHKVHLISQAYLHVFAKSEDE